MSKSRKTIPVVDVISMINHRLQHSTCSDSERLAMASIAEEILVRTNTYGGYVHLDGFQYGTATHNESRRHYFIKGI